MLGLLEAHYWDPSKAVGRYFRHRIIPDYTRGPIVWDTFIVFGRDGTWKEARKHVLGWGRTIVGDAEKLMTLVEAIQK